jgi:protein-S-isoprenylcysteine O-methyltransferase Ste14
MSERRRILPPIYFLGALAGMGALHVVAPITRLVQAPYRYAGVVFVGFGFWIVIWAARLFGRAGTPIKPFQPSTHLVTGGPYRFTRNPMYLGMVAILAGVGLLLGSLGPFLVIPTFVYVIQRDFITREEALMEQTFGEGYLSFRRRVRRWI